MGFRLLTFLVWFLILLIIIELIKSSLLLAEILEIIFALHAFVSDFLFVAGICVSRVSLGLCVTDLGWMWIGMSVFEVSAAG